MAMNSDLNSYLGRPVRYRGLSHQDTLARVLEKLTNRNLLEQGKDSFTNRFVEQYVRDYPRRNNAKWREKARQFQDSMPDFAWAVRDLMEGEKFPDAAALMRHYAGLHSVACDRSACSALRVGCAYALRALPEPARCQDTAWVADYLVNDQELAHQRIELVWGLVIETPRVDPLKG